MYAHVSNGTLDSPMASAPPAHVFIDDRWWDLRPLDPELLAFAGWYLVQETDQPDDTATHTSEPAYNFNNGVVEQSWVVVPKTPEQLASELAASNEAAIRQLLTDTMPALQIITDKTNATFTDNEVRSAVKDLARANRRIIRILTNNLSATN